MFLDEFIPDKLADWLLQKEKEELLEIMLEAISLMQGWNGASIRSVVFEAAGWTLDEEKRVWRAPK